MKKKLFVTYCLFVSSMAGIRVMAQISITQSNMPKSGDTIRYSTANLNTALVSSNLAKIGGSQSWNFASLVSNGQNIYEYKNSLQTPYAFYFFNKLGLKTADSLGTGLFSFKNIYSFYTSNVNVFKTEGLGYSYENIPLAATYKDDDEIYSFPLNYHDSDISTFYFVFSLPVGNLFQYVQGGKRINYVDAWGSITTPYQTYNSVLRVKTTIDQVDTIITQFGEIPIPRKQVIYRWLSGTERIPVLEITGTELSGVFAPLQINYRDKYQTGNQVGLVNMDRKVNSLLYPNPASDKIFLNIKPGLNVQIFDATGRFVNQLIYQPSAGINVKSLNRGVYSIRVSEQGSTILRFVKE